MVYITMLQLVVLSIITLIPFVMTVWLDATSIAEILTSARVRANVQMPMGRRVTRPQNAHWKSDGTAKVEYTEDEARAKCAELWNLDMDNGRLMTFPGFYKCSECEWWHVGNVSKKQRS